jgi:hypothetical protein
VNFAGHNLDSGTILLFAVGLFFLTGVYVLAKQGIRSLAIIVAVLAAMAIAGGVLRL